MIVSLRWLGFIRNICLFMLLILSALNYKTSVYLFYQAKGQLSLLLETRSLSDFEKDKKLSQQEKENIFLIKEIKKFSVDSLNYKPTKNFTSIYDQKGKPVLWVITACSPYELKPYEWNFPLLGNVSYKGFFKKELALKECTHLVALGYDVDLRSVSAWSTLGWLHDPVLSSMLKRSKGSLCNLIFHELFHATYYASSSVDLNENIASFIAHEATQRFLINDPDALKEYLVNYEDNKIFSKYMLRSIVHLKSFYALKKEDPRKYILKLKILSQLADSVSMLPLQNPAKFVSRKEEMLKSKNAYFVDFVQYDSMQDSLDEVFNKIYKGKIEKMVQDLKLN